MKPVALIHHSANRGRLHPPGSLPGLKIGGQPGERLGSDLTGLDWHSRGRVRDLAVAAPGADTDGAGGGSNQGAVYLFGLRPAE